VLLLLLLRNSVRRLHQLLDPRLRLRLRLRPRLEA
jgi:hypothetical protein